MVLMKKEDFNFDLGIPRDKKDSVLFHLLLQQISYNRAAMRAIAGKLLQPGEDKEAFLNEIEEEAKRNYHETKSQVLTWFGS